MKKPKGALLLAVVGLLLAACGTRLDKAEFAAKSQAGSTQEEVSDGSGSTGTNGSTGGTQGGTDTATSATTGGDTGGTTGAVDTTGGTGGAATGGGATGGGATGGPNRASDIGITATTISLGNITAENGVLGDAFAPAARGIRAWTAWINANGGINGRKVQLFTCDDGEVRSKTLACAQQLVEQDHVFAIVSSNTRAMGGAAQYLNDKGVPTIGMPITNSFYRYPHFWSEYPNGYVRNGTTVGYNGKLIGNTVIDQWFKQNLHVTKAAVFEYDIAESKQAGDEFAEGLRLSGFQVDTYQVSFAAPSFDQGVAGMQQRGTQIIFDTMDDGANRKLCDAMARRQFKVAAKVSTVVSMGDAVGTTYNDTCRGSVYIPGFTHAYSDTSNPAIAQFRAAYAKYQPGKPLHEWALEAWAQGQMVAEGLKTMGGAPTRKGLEAWFRTLNKYTAGGIWIGLDWQPRDYAAKTGPYCTTVAHWDDGNKKWVDETGKGPFCATAIQYGATALEQGN
jgi:ABC-type branched-subunit amino acid transport system substrate-binding protein